MPRLLCQYASRRGRGFDGSTNGQSQHTHSRRHESSNGASGREETFLTSLTFAASNTVKPKAPAFAEGDRAQLEVGRAAHARISSSRKRVRRCPAGSRGFWHPREAHRSENEWAGAELRGIRPGRGRLVVVRVDQEIAVVGHRHGWHPALAGHGGAAGVAAGIVGQPNEKFHSSSSAPAGPGRAEGCMYCTGCTSRCWSLSGTLATAPTM